jgi:hypothetical protein
MSTTANEDPDAVATDSLVVKDDEAAETAEVTETGEKEAVAEEAAGPLRGKAAKVFADMDTNGGGTIDFEEFTQAMERLGHTIPQDKLRQVFEETDADNSGEIDQKEFAQLLDSLGCDMDNLDLNIFADTLINNKIFKTVLTVGAAASNPTSMVSGGLESTVEKIPVVGGLLGALVGMFINLGFFAFLAWWLVVAHDAVKSGSPTCKQLGTYQTYHIAAAGISLLIPLTIQGYKEQSPTLFWILSSTAGVCVAVFLILYLSINFKAQAKACGTSYSVGFYYGIFEIIVLFVAVIWGLISSCLNSTKELVSGAVSGLSKNETEEAADTAEETA